ncbi:MAG TPA: hypothetical protein VGA13_02915 [Acidimicrobiales bacterium]
MSPRVATDIVDEAVLASAIARYLPQQRWFLGDRHALARAEIRDLEVLNDEWPILVWAIVTGELKSGARTDYQVIAGLRPPGELEFLDHIPTALMGEVPTRLGPAIAYNALHDPELARMLLRRLAPDESASYVRQTGAEVATSVLVYDERLLLRIFRRLPDGPNPDVETVRALASQGFRNVSAPLAGWCRGDVDLAVLREFVAGGAEGWQLALTSLRDLYDRRTAPNDAPGDFGPEARRLGSVIADLHRALANVFGRHPADPSRWADRLRSRLDEVRHLDVDADGIEKLAQRLAGIADAGHAIRIHGDLTLRRVMRTDAGWFVLGFEGERLRAAEAVGRVTSPLEDIAKLLRSIHLASRVAIDERSDDVDDDLTGHAAAWEQWIGRCYLEGYSSAIAGSGLLAVDDGDRALVLTAFELIHALRDLRRAHEDFPHRVDSRLEAVDGLVARVPVS